jgi:two-component system cell cycle sensor histidine kinase/response regulator CckA
MAITPLRLLLVEDSADDAELLLRELRRAGYDPTYTRVQMAAELKAALAAGSWDLVISDYILPRFSAPEALAIIQHSRLDLPFIIVSGAIGEETAVAAMLAGARDYIMKDKLGRLGPAIVRELREAEMRREREQLEEQFRRVQRIEAIGRLAGAVAHDFNNLLTVIRGRSELLLKRLGPNDPGRCEADLIRDAATKAASLTRQLLIFSRGEVLQAKVLDLNAVITEIEPMLRRLVGEGITFYTALAPALGSVKADQAQIEQVIMNLLVNARDAMPNGGCLSIVTANAELGEDYCRSHVDARPGPHVMLAVSDTGVGMDPDTQAHLFEPFFTTKGPDQGTGLGLAVVYGIVKQSGGWISVVSEPGRGTAFTIYLPRVDAEVERTAALGTWAGSLDGSETILLVEDQPEVQATACDILQQHGYTVLVAGHGGEALQLAAQYAGEIHLLLTDVVMPHVGGRELVRRLVPLRPHMKVLYMSGYTDETVSDYKSLGAAFVQKPFTLDVLARKVREVLNGPQEQGGSAP